MYTLFLDDLRQPTHELEKPIVVARDFDEFKAVILEHGVPSAISFDHDLGEFPNGEIKPTAMKCLWWLIDRQYDQESDLTQVKRVIVHTANPVGSKNLRELWNNFADDIDSPVRAENKPQLT